MYLTAAVAAAIVILVSLTGPAVGQPPTIPGAPPETGAPPAAPGQQPETAVPPAAPGQQPVSPERPPGGLPSEAAPPAPEAGVPAPELVSPAEAAPVAPEAPRAERPGDGGRLTFIGPDLFNPPPPRGWITLTPSFTVGGEFSESDVTGEVVPGLTLSMQAPRYRLLAGYNFTWDFFDDERGASDFAARQQLFANGFYQVSPRIRLTLTEQFVVDDDSAAVGDVSAGRQTSVRNTAAAGVEWQAMPLTRVRATVSQTHLKFEGGSDARSSETYRVRLGADRRLTRRLRGSVDLLGAYFDVAGEPGQSELTPQLGLTYQFTPTLAGAIGAGPSLLVRDSQLRVAPAVSTRLNWSFKFGVLQAGYDQRVASTTVGVSTRQAVFASLGSERLVRGLLVELSPRYAINEREGDQRDADVMRTLSLDLRMTYQIARNVALIGSYTFRREFDTEATDENRVFVGLQYAFPISFY